MFVCVVSLSQPSVVEICYMLNVCVCCLVISAQCSRDLLYVKCLCVVSLSQPSVVEICYMLNVCVCCLVISAQCSRDLDYPLWDVPYLRSKNVSRINRLR